MFTINNYTPADLTRFTSWVDGSVPLPRDIHYLVAQTEVAPGTGTPHIQGYLELKRRLSWNQIKTLLGNRTTHLEKRLGTQDQAITYCLKEDTRAQGENYKSWSIVRKCFDGYNLVLTMC